MSEHRPADVERAASSARAGSASARPPVVCLCGSVQFAAEIRAVERGLTLAGTIVLAPALLEPAVVPLTDQQRAALGRLHLARIDLADRVVVVDPGGYLGESTRREVRYALRARKPVDYTEPPGDAVDR
ncbi:MAG TPA: hypothetical protein VGC67_04130 [Cellulomonas sp.]